MFAKLFCMFMAVLLLALGGVGLTTYANMRNRQIDARLGELKKQAREIAYLASQNTASAASYFFGSDTTTLDYLELEGCRGCMMTSARISLWWIAGDRL